MITLKKIKSLDTTSQQLATAAMFLRSCVAQY